MSFFAPLPPHLTDAVLRHLDVEPVRYDRDWLDGLLERYGATVPWESASRIARVSTTPRDECPRLPEAFWQSAVATGTGGTCFESNAALSALLASTGFAGYLTINDMGDTRGCHTALVVDLAGTRHIVDAGYPLYAALPLDTGPTSRTSPWLTYDVVPVAPHRYRVENRPHPNPYVFDLVDAAVTPAAYEAALRADYAPGGLFLDRVVLRKIVDGRVWRFASTDRPWQLECFIDGTRITTPLPAAIDAAADRLANHFGMPATIVATALVALVESTLPRGATSA